MSHIPPAFETTDISFFYQSLELGIIRVLCQVLIVPISNKRRAKAGGTRGKKCPHNRARPMPGRAPSSSNTANNFESFQNSTTLNFQYNSARASAARAPFYSNTATHFEFFQNSTTLNLQSFIHLYFFFCSQPFLIC